MFPAHSDCPVFVLVLCCTSEEGAIRLACDSWNVNVNVVLVSGQKKEDGRESTLQNLRTQLHSSLPKNIASETEIMRPVPTTPALRCCFN